MTTGNVEITILDFQGGSVVTPASSVQVVIGTCCAGSASANSIISTRSLQTLTTQMGYGQIPEYAALAVQAGGTVLAIKATQNAAGTASGVVSTSGNTGSSTVTVTLDGTYGAYDDYYVKLKVVAGGTRGTTGITVQVSLDAGRTYGPVLALGTAVTLAIANTGVTIAFGAGILVAGDTYTFATAAPTAAVAGISSALTALQTSPYAITGWGSIHVLGTWSAADAATIQGYLNTLATGYIFTRTLLSARDASPQSKWGGSGESDSSWVTSLTTDYATASAKRVDVSGGFYNMPTAITNSTAGTPRYRRSGQWAAAARQVAIPPQRHAGRVRDGALAQIVIDAPNDPLDGFVYHDERLNPGLDAARFTSYTTRVGLPGYYVVNPNLMSPPGSDFSLLPLGLVMDVACDIVHQVGQLEINSDVRLNQNGTLYVNEAVSLESTLLSALNNAMTNVGMISSASVVVDQTNNVQVSKTVNIAVTITARGYVLQENVTIGFNNPNAAQ